MNNKEALTIRFKPFDRLRVTLQILAAKVPLTIKTTT
jgi:hypothetical protein